MGRSAHAALAPITPERVARSPSSSARCSATPPSPHRSASSSTTCCSSTSPRHHGWAQYNRHHWREDYHEFLSGSSPAASPSRTRPRRSRTASAGRSTPTPRRSSTRRTAIASAGREPCVELAARAWTVPCSWSTATATRSARREGACARPRPAADCVTLAGSGHFPHARNPVQVNLAATRLPAEDAFGTDAYASRTPGPTAAGARCTSPRRSASATPSATSRSRASCAGSTPTSRSTGSPRTRSPACSQAEGERIHPASAHLANESRPHRVASPPSTTCTASRRCGGWTRSCSPTSWSSTTSSASEPLRPLDRRRGLGARLLPAREPRAEARAVRVADRLRRLAADGRRRRA